MLEHRIDLQPGEVFADPVLVQGNPRIKSLIRRQRAFGFTLAAIAIVIYMGFFALVAFAPSLLASPNALFGSVGFLLVFVMFVIAWALTWLYLRQTTRVLGPMADAARKEIFASMQTPVGAR